MAAGPLHLCVLVTKGIAACGPLGACPPTWDLCSQQVSASSCSLESSCAFKNILELGLILVVQDYTPATQEAEAGGSGIQGQPGYIWREERVIGYNVHACHPALGEAKAQRSQVESHPWLHRELKTSMSYIRPCFTYI